MVDWDPCLSGHLNLTVVGLLVGPVVGDLPVTAALAVVVVVVVQSAGVAVALLPCPNWACREWLGLLDY